MDRIAGITLLFDTFSEESQNLYESFQNAGIAVNAAVIDEDGFLPEGVMSAYGFFLEDESEDKENAGKPRYFNQIDVPDYWQIEGNNSSAKVMNHDKEVARIFYHKPTHKRLVRVVDWLDERNVVRLCEHYNQHGNIFCRTILNKNGQKVMRRFYSAGGEERIVESFVTGDILVKYHGRDWIFRNKTELVKFFLICAGLGKTKLYYNSLSYPFFTSQIMEENGHGDALFWNEPVREEIPGNMQVILNRKSSRTGMIYVQRKDAYEKLIELGAAPDITKCLGYVYSFCRNNEHRPEVLICTNSDRVLHLRELAAMLPEVQFHVAAITEMSSRLMAAGENKNVYLYPNITQERLDKLFSKCDLYLDINRESEICDAVHQAFLNNLLIVGFEETLHNTYYTAPTNTFPEKEFREMANSIHIALQMPRLIDDALEMQRKQALAATPEEYRELIMQGGMDTK